jgi:putative oxidoreductase
MENPQAIALLTLRVFIGVVFFFQGYDKVFRIKVKNVISTYHSTLENHNLPPALITLAAFFTSYAELAGGLLLALGLFKLPVIYLLTFDIFVASVAFSIMQPMWNMQHVFPRLAILIALLLLPQDWDIFTLDAYIQSL